MLSLDQYALDPDDADSALVWQAWGDSNLSVQIDARVGMLTPRKDWSGRAQAVFQVRDPEGHADTDTMEVGVLPVNDPPVLSSLPDTSFESGDTLRLDLRGFVKDVDDPVDSLRWEVRGNEVIQVGIEHPGGALLTVPQRWEGQEWLIFEVWDRAGASHGDTVLVQVYRRVYPPVLSLPDTSFAEDDSLMLPLDRYALDPDDADSALVWQAWEDSNLSVQIDDRVGMLIPRKDWSGRAQAVFQVRDPDGHADTDTMEVGVLPVNDPPVLSSLPDVELSGGEKFWLDLKQFAQDVDDSLKALQWRVEKELGLVSVDSSGVALFSAPSDWEGEKRLIFWVSDAAGAATNDTMTARVTKRLTLPEEYALYPNYPNPFLLDTRIRFDLPSEGQVRLIIYNMLGQRVRMLVDSDMKVGQYLSVWDGRDSSGRKVGSGIYFYRLRTDSFDKTRKMMRLNRDR